MSRSEDSQTMSFSEDGKMSGRRRESGFAMLLVFVLAAAIAITLFIEVPRIAFESQRTREQMTIDRALQYQRAIQLFYRKYHLYPQSLDDLETTRNIRFLRHRYLDPLTGKEYRLLHVGPSGQLTDSLIQPPSPLPGSSTGSGPSSSPTSAQTSGTAQSSNPSQSSNSSQPSDPNNPNAQAPDPLNMALRRPSDRVIPTGPTALANGGQPGDTDPNPPPEQQPQPQDPAQAGQQPGQPGQPGLPAQPGQPGIPGQPADPNQASQPQFPQQPQDPSQQPQFPGQVPPQYPGQQPQYPGQQAQYPGQQAQYPGQVPQYPGQVQQYPGQQPNPGQTPIPGQTFPFQQGQMQPGAQGGTPGAAGLPGAAMAGGAGAQGNQAANMIQQLLTTPRQPPSSVGNFTTGNTGGIAGVASTAEGKGIHVVNDHTKYKEWEFIYDLKKDPTVIGAAGVAQQQQIQQQMQPGGAGTPGSSPFGSSSFGSSPASSPSQTAPAAPAAPTTPPPSQ
jgi:hypothetical protein